MKEAVEQAKNQLNSWGQYTYHTTYLDGEKYEGMRDCMKRVNKMYFNPRCRILDLGCNMAGMLWPYRLYFGQAVGVERDTNVFNFCKNLAKAYNAEKKMKFIQYDLNKIDDLDYLGEFDVIFCLAITQHISEWQKVLRWAHEHGKILFIEYNGQPNQLKDYMNYTQGMRGGFDYLGEYNGRFLYTVYNPINFTFGGEKYQTYKINSGANVDVYYCHAKNAVVKCFRNKSWEPEVEWCKKLDCAPDIIHVDADNDIVAQEFAGQFLTYFNTPDDYIEQVDKIKAELVEKECRGEDVELHVKDGKIKIVDLGACTPLREDEQNEDLAILDGRIDKEMEYIRFRRIQYLAGQQISVFNNGGI